MRAACGMRVVVDASACAAGASSVPPCGRACWVVRPRGCVVWCVFSCADCDVRVLAVGLNHGCVACVSAILSGRWLEVVGSYPPLRSTSTPRLRTDRLHNLTDASSLCPTPLFCQGGERAAPLRLLRRRRRRLRHGGGRAAAQAIARRRPRGQGAGDEAGAESEVQVVDFCHERQSARAKGQHFAAFFAGEPPEPRWLSGATNGRHVGLGHFAK